MAEQEDRTTVAARIQNPPPISRAALSRPHWVRALVCLAGAAALTGAANPVQPQPGGQQQQPAQQAGAQPAMNTNKPYLLPEANRTPDANDIMEMRQQKEANQKQDYIAANSERKKQISDDSTRLLKLATELKGEVDKTTKDTLSLNVIRKAEEIEKLAHDVKEKMKLSVSGN